MGFSPMLLALLVVFNCIFFLSARYVGVPQTTANLRAVLKRELDLKCIYEGDGSGEFDEWYKDGVPISKETPGHYIIKHSEKESVLKIKIFVNADAEVRQWYVKTKKSGSEEPTACRFDQIALQPSPQGIATERANEELDSMHGSVRRSEDQSVRFKCVIEPEAVVGHSGVKWQFSADGSAYGETPADVALEDDELVIQRVKKFHRGYYQCGLNNVTFTALLRVKDRLAALWPFLGIVGVVVVLVGVILIFEKRHASSKRAAAADDDDQDQANDPLVRTTTKSSDNDSKKRAVKA